MIAIIPAAGRGTRVKHKTKGGSKELLKYKGKPAIQWAIEEVTHLVNHIYIIVHASKQDLINWLLLYPCTVPITILDQKECKGLGDAILQVKAFVSSDKSPNLLIILPDEVFPDENVSSKLIEVGHSIAVKRMARKNLTSYGVIRKSKTIPLSFSEVVEKPSVEEVPSNLAVVGRYYLPYMFFDCLRLTPALPGKEQDMSKALRLFTPLRYVEIKSKRKDLGKA